MEKYLEAVFKLLADKVEDDWVYAGVDRREVDAKIIQDQQETANRQRFISAEHRRSVALRRSFKVSTGLVQVTHLSSSQRVVSFWV